MTFSPSALGSSTEKDDSMIKKSWVVRCAASSAIVVAGLVIAVRRGAADAPPGQYTISNGTVADNKTGLVWQQVGSASTYTWPDAGTYCTSNTAGLPGTGWRLPSLNELQSIVDDSRQGPCLDPTAFAGEPADLFWTSSPVVGAAGSAWLVAFGNGATGSTAATTAHRVRCVR
jgi:hypothetical protein